MEMLRHVGKYHKNTAYLFLSTDLPIPRQNVFHIAWPISETDKKRSQPCMIDDMHNTKGNNHIGLRESVSICAPSDAHCGHYPLDPFSAMSVNSCPEWRW